MNDMIKAVEEGQARVLNKVLNYEFIDNDSKTPYQYLDNAITELSVLDSHVEGPAEQATFQAVTDSIAALSYQLAYINGAAQACLNGNKPEDSLLSFVKFVAVEHVSAYRILKCKNADYADDSNPLRNFMVCEDKGICSHTTGILVRMCDKLSRIHTGVRRNLQVDDESFSDTCRDLANYAHIYFFARSQEYKNKV